MSRIRGDEIQRAIQAVRSKVPDAAECGVKDEIIRKLKRGGFSSEEIAKQTYKGDASEDNRRFWNWVQYIERLEAC